MESTKIGKSVLNTSKKSKEDLLTRTWYQNSVPTREKVLNVLRDCKKEQLSITKIAQKLEISWTTARNALTELLLLGLVTGERKGRELLFSLKKNGDE